MRYTPKLHLPIFEKGETPALIGDLNAAMLTIDDNAGGGGGITVVNEGDLDSYSPETLGELMQDHEYDFVVVAGAIAYGHGSGADDSYYFNSVVIPFYHGGTITEEDKLTIRLTAADNVHIEYVTDYRSTDFTANASSNITIEKHAVVYGVKL